MPGDIDVSQHFQVSQRFQAIAASVEPDAARLAFEALRPLLDARTELRAANIDVDRAVLFAASVGRMVRQPGMRARFAGLPAREFDIGHVDRLESAALAVWHTCTELSSARARSSGRRIPATMHAEAAAVKQRMHEVLTYHLDHLSEVTTQLDAMGAGPGSDYLLLAESLLGLADLYQRHESELAGDVRRYRPSDRELAGRLAHAIHHLLGEPARPEVVAWTGHRARAWALLVETYEEVRAAGRWLFRHENGEELFASLYTAGRGPRRRRTRAQIEAAEAAAVTEAAGLPRRPR
jgi:hypothetical protein